MAGYEDISSMAKLTKCICPRCKKNHFKAIFWTGKGTPKIMCIICDNYIKNKNISEIDYHNALSISKRQGSE